MPSTTLTSKGQITVPRTIREQMHWKTGDRLDFTIESDGRVVVEQLGGDAKRLRGILRREEGPALSVEAMDDAIGRHLGRKYERR